MLNIYRIQDSFVLTIFGASGDLAKLKLFPALYSLAEQKRLPKDFFVIGFARTQKNDQQFQQEFQKSIEAAQGKDLNKKILTELTKHVHYFTGKYDQLKSFQAYQTYLQKLTKGKKCPHITYFSVPPLAFKPIIKNLGQSRTSKNQDIRLIIEKPFGQDAASANDLFHFLSGYFSEEQVYLLDHYLGKAGVQSILNLRQSNRILNILLRGSEIANIQISALEKLGIKDRVGYFNQVGIVKDFIQSHLLQILALTTMSIPISGSAQSLHREKYSILSAIQVPSSPGYISIGQYDTYKKENGVPANSTTETFAAAKLYIDQNEWYRVPIYLRVGKQLKDKHTYIAIEFKKYSFQKKTEEPNLLLIELGPEEKIAIKLVNKYRSGGSQYENITTSESIACSGDYCLPEHGILLLDVIRNNKTSFLSFPEILASWNVTEAILNNIKKQKVRLEKYASNSWGPPSQDKIPAKDGFKWHSLT